MKAFFYQGFLLSCNANDITVLFLDSIENLKELHTFIVGRRILTKPVCKQPNVLSDPTYGNPPLVSSFGAATLKEDSQAFFSHSSLSRTHSVFASKMDGKCP